MKVGNRREELKTSITIKYLGKQGIQEKEFARYALFGKWMTKNYTKIKSILHVTVRGNY